ncbi:MAG TPA: M56 family metallopeptidase, partial [Verrucomicrobiae bacterium]|nr:M56 family metallopeptidase [Verrucomicrobiae bacterium]
VSFVDTISTTSLPPAVPVVVPLPKLGIDAGALLAAVLTAAGLFLWLVLRWLRIARKVRRAATASGELDCILEEAWQLAGLRRRPRLKLIDEAQSPAVYGLLSPVILLPQALAGKLSARQLRAVMLHELVHLRRGDVWINCAQTLLQIAYWWHPLLWVGNARTRRVREEAVDDAVMFALSDGADAYAPTLLEVAKYAFRRPLASLGLIGILESRSALRQRVERLMDFRPSRKAGITFLSSCGIIAFCAVALPMGRGPERTTATPPDSQSSPSFKANASAVPGLEMRAFRVGTNIFFANLRDLAGPQISASNINISAFLKEFFQAAGVDLSPPKTVFFNERLGGVLFVHATPSDLDVIESIVEILHESGGGENLWLTSINNRTASPGAARTHDKAVLAAGRDSIYCKLSRLRLTSVSYHDRPLNEIMRDLRRQSLKLDPDRTGINFLFNPNGGEASSSQTQIDPNTIRITLNLTNVSLLDVFNEVCMVSDRPIKYSVEDYGIVFSPKGRNSPPYEMRTFKINPDKFYSNLINDLPDPRNIEAWKVSKALPEYFSRLGVKLDPPKTVFYNDRLEVLFVYATPHDLDVIERALSEMGDLPSSQYNVDDSERTNENAIFRQAEMALDQALATERKAAHMDLTPAEGAHSSQTPYYLARGSMNNDLSDPISGAKASVSADSASQDTNDFEQRTFPVSVRAFVDAVRAETRETDPIAGFVKLAAKAGVDFSPPKVVFLNDGLGFIYVYASTSDMGTIQHILDGLHCAPPQLHIKARYIEVPNKFLSSDLVKSMFPGLTNGGVLSGPEFHLFLRQLYSQAGVRELAEPEVTTLSGRETEMRATVTRSVITNFIVEASAGANGSTFAPQTIQVETGPIFTVVASLLADDHTINLMAIATQIDFLGYRTSNGLAPNVTPNLAGTAFSPVFQVKDESMSKKLPDGQTLVLFPKAQAGWKDVPV